MAQSGMEVRSLRRATWLQRLFPEGWLTAARWLGLVILTAWALFSLFPLYWAIITSFKPASEISAIRPSLIVRQVSLDSYRRFLQGVGFANAPVVRWFLNTILVTVANVLGTLFVCSMAGYSFARKQFWGRDTIFWALIFSMLIPGWSTLVPGYILTRQWGMHDTYWVLTLPYLPAAFGVFLIRQFTVTLPEELFQSARVDGASELQLYNLIALPLMRPVLATLGMFTLLSSWNDFLWPMLTLNKVHLYTVSVGAALMMYQFRGSGPNYGVAMAVATLMSAAPVVAFLIMQRNMIRGLTIGALKG